MRMGAGIEVLDSLDVAGPHGLDALHPVVRAATLQHLEAEPSGLAKM